MKRILREPTPILIRVERWQRELLDALAQHNGHSLNREMQLAVVEHLRIAEGNHVDDRADGSRTANAPQLAGGGANAKTYSKDEAGGLEE